MTGSYLVSTALMGALVVTIVVALARTSQWQDYAPPARRAAVGDADAAGAERPGSGPAALLRDPTAWIVGFVALSLATVGGVMAFVTNPDAPAALFGGPVVLVGGALVGLYLLGGVYVAARERGHASSLAAAETATVFGVLFLVAVLAQLVG